MSVFVCAKKSSTGLDKKQNQAVPLHYLLVLFIMYVQMVLIDKKIGF